MTWAELLAKLDFFDHNDPWGQTSLTTIGYVSSTDRTAIELALKSLFDNSTLAGAALETLASDPRGLRIADVYFRR